MRIRSVIGALGAALGLVAAGAFASVAQEVAPVATQHAQLRLLPASTGLDAEGRATVGLEFRLDEGWHIYWRSPGDAGLPPGVDWAASANLADTAFRWPRPTRYELLGIQTLAYSDHVIFPVRVTAADPAAPLDLKADVAFLICAEICIPDRASLSLSLPPGGGGATDFTYDIDRFEALVPLAPPQAGLAIAGVATGGSGQDGSLTVTVAATVPMTAVDLFVEAGPTFVFDRPQPALAADGLSATFAVPVQAWGADVATLADEPLTLTVVADARAMETSLVPATFDPARADAAVTAPPPATDTPAAPAPVDFAAFVGILAVAVLGGLILNLMPCVLPVLSLKVLSVVSHGGGDRREVRRSFLASAAGILVSFMVLAAAAIGLRTAGVAVGWGMQFQQPVFLAVMLVIVALFAYSLLGLFEIRLPGTVSDLAAGAGGPGPSKSLRSHFLTGAFATLLATPCTAPFVGTALGFALARGPGEILAIFLAMGVGLALPYLLIALVPAVATRLPRPGRWMVWLTRVLGLALAATAVWLVTVLAGQIGWEAAGGAAALVLLIGAVFLVRRHLPEARIGRLAGYAAGVLALATVGSAAIAPQAVREAPEAGGIAWRSFDRSSISGWVVEGRVVFVDVTADWCLTCIYNKTTVLDQEPIRSLLGRDGGVIAMLADWTNPDPAIADYLASFGRYGIPFNAVYGPAAPQGIALPELLTEGAVIDAINAAAGASGATLAER
ncbi:MAG: protein-disulfide reductase DsbD family protein [Alphaproteobacteria bacterium]